CFVLEIVGLTAPGAFKGNGHESPPVRNKEENLDKCRTTFCQLRATQSIRIFDAGLKSRWRVPNALYMPPRTSPNTRAAGIALPLVSVWESVYLTATALPEL